MYIFDSLYKAVSIISEIFLLADLEKTDASQNENNVQSKKVNYDLSKRIQYFYLISIAIFIFALHSLSFNFVLNHDTNFSSNFLPLE